MRHRAEELNYLGEIIDRYVTEDKTQNQGPFHFLREDMVIRALSGTATGRANATGLKTYLAKEILKINEGGSYVTYKNILENLRGEAKKKYKTDIHDLEMCFDWEENREILAEEIGNFQFPVEKFPVKLGEEKIPWILLRLLQEDAERHLLKIWELQDSYSAGEEFERRLQEEYMKALHAMALQEIFYKEFLVLPAKRNLADMVRQADTVQKMADTLERFADAGESEKDIGWKPEEIRHIAEQMRDKEQELREIVQSMWKLMRIEEPDRIQQENTERLDSIQRLVERQYLYLVLEMEQNLDLGVEFQILTMFEAMNISSRENTAGETLKNWMYKNEKWIWEIFERNPNRSAIYHEMDDYACEMLVDYWSRQPKQENREGYQGFLDALDVYFEQLHWKYADGRKYNAEEMKKAKETIVESNREYWRSVDNRNGDKREEK